MRKSPLSYGTHEKRPYRVMQCRLSEATVVHCDRCGIVGDTCHPYFKLGSLGWMHRSGAKTYDSSAQHKIRYGRIEYIDGPRPVSATKHTLREVHERIKKTQDAKLLRAVGGTP